MAITKKNGSRAKLLVVAVGLAAAAILGLKAYNNHQEQVERRETKSLVIEEARKGGHNVTELAMKAHPELWRARSLSITDVNKLTKANALATVGVVDEFSTGHGMAELLITTNSGLLGYIKDTGRGVLTENLLKSIPDKAYVVRINIPRSAWEVFFSTLGKLLMSLLLPLLILGMLLAQLAPMLTRFKLAKNVSTRFSDVVGVPDAKAALQDIMDFMKDPDAYAKLGAKPSRGVLLSGPPGTGKTLLAKALAGECGVSFISCSGADFSSTFYGMGIAKVKRLFAAARKEKQCIIFIDEIDGIGQRTSSARGPESSEFNRIINQFLVEMDGFKEDERIIVIGATNLTDNLDPALLRDGRFDRKIMLRLPTVGEREELFKAYGSKLSLATDIDFAQLARLTFGLSPAAIANLVNQAAIRAARDRVPEVGMTHLAEAIETAHLGETSGLELSDEERYRTAIHEAGHAWLVVKRKTGQLEKVTVLPRGSALGLTVASQQEKVHLYTQEALLARIDMLLAGRAAEEVILGSISIGASDDLKRATEIATAMLANYGFGDGLAVLTPEQVQSAQTRKAVNQLLDTRYIETKTLLSADRAVIEKIAAQLLEEETIDGKVVEALAA